MEVFLVILPGSCHYDIFVSTITFVDSVDQRSDCTERAV